MAENDTPQGAPAPTATPQNTAPTAAPAAPPTAAPVSPVVTDNKASVAAPAVAKSQATPPKVVVKALVSCAPSIGHLRLNLIKDKKYLVEAWVAPVLEEGKMAVKLETA